MHFEASLARLIEKADDPAYLYWTDLKRKSWLPKTVTPEQYWLLVKNSRTLRCQKTAISDENGEHFSWVRCARFDPILHEIDLNTGGRFLGLEPRHEKQRQSYISYNLIEESIASAQLEGAHTTRREAVKMIREGRKPADRSQHMIFNNYRAMQAVEGDFRNGPLTLERLLDLHHMLTKNTMDDPGQAGRLRRDDENIVVEGPDGLIAHTPPAMPIVRREIERLIAWANDELVVGPFIHPVIKAICIHFWLGYLHPFTDGNGRLARTLFYWYLLRKGYWAFAFIPISTRIKKSPVQYGWAYIYSEQDDNDLTYFIDYNIRQIELARKDFETFLSKEAGKKASSDWVMREWPQLNDRQRHLIQYLSTHENERTNMTSVVNLFGVTPATAVKDLKTLQSMGLLVNRRQGKNVFYFATDLLKKRVP